MSEGVKVREQSRDGECRWHCTLVYCACAIRKKKRREELVRDFKMLSACET